MEKENTEKYSYLSLETMSQKNKFVKQNHNVPMLFVDWYKYAFHYVSGNGRVSLCTPYSGSFLSDIYRTELKAEMSLGELWKAVGDEATGLSFSVPTKAKDKTA